MSTGNVSLDDGLLPFKFSANGPEKDPAAQEMMNGA